MNNLIPLEEVNALQVFSSAESLEYLLREIRATATAFMPDVSTPAGRKEIAAQAYKVSQSKIVIDNAGKALSEDWYNKKKIVDEGRLRAREVLDALRDEIRQPLTEWEQEEARRAAELAIKAEIEAAELEAYAMEDLFERERKVRAAEARIFAEEMERARVAQEKADEKARKEMLAKLKKEADERAKKKAEDELRQARERAEKAERDRAAAEENAERQRIAAEQRAEREKQEAIERERRLAQDKADRLEKDRLRIQEEERLEAQRRAADQENRRSINRAAVEAFIAGGVSEKVATTVIKLIAGGKIPAVSIRY